ncbi:hypothetical protein [Candidatus Mesenet endosymbiont of Agriotes lineatus]|uniref:hypothetical protein n=1 Tax=Candidatus Mesenet endosymbiont of Agriotes lineatus TaxID=3077948 RepID=UPI0030D0196D
MVMKSDALLIFDFDNTITNGHMHNTFSKLEKSDFNTAAKYAVTNDDISNFLENTGGIKNEESLKSRLESALSNGIAVNIASYTGYPNAVKKVVEGYLDLSKEQSGGISVFGGFPKDYDVKLPEDIKEQQNQVGKNLHIYKAIVEYKEKHGKLPKTVMLVDDSIGNIRKVNEFTSSIEKEWLEKNGLNFEDIKNIEFEGVQASHKNKNGKTTGDINYLEKVQEFINTNLVHEPIHKNLKKEGPIYAAVEKSTISLAKPMKEIKSFCVQNNYGDKEIIRGAQSVFKETVIKAINKQGYSVKSSEEEESEIIVKGSKSIDVEGIITDVLNQIMVASNEVLSDRRDKNLKELKQESINENLREIGPIYQNLQDIKTTEPIYQNTEELSFPPPLPPKPQYLHAAASHDSIGKNKEEDIYTKKSTISLAHWFETIKSSFTDCSQKIINAIHSSFKKIVRAKIKEQGYVVSSEKGKCEITICGNKPIDVQKIKTDIIDTYLIQTMKLDKGKIKDLSENYQGVELREEISKLLNVDLHEKNVSSNSVSRSPPERQAPPSSRNCVEMVIHSRNIENNVIGRNG